MSRVPTCHSVVFTLFVMLYCFGGTAFGSDPYFYKKKFFNIKFQYYYQSHKESYMNMPSGDDFCSCTVFVHTTKGAGGISYKISLKGCRWLYWNCAMSLYQVLPHGITVKGEKQNGEHAEGEEDDYRSMYLFWQVGDPKYINSDEDFIFHKHINTKCKGPACREDYIVWKPDLFISICPDSRLKRCLLPKYKFVCSSNEKCNVLWHRLPIFWTSNQKYQNGLFDREKLPISMRDDWCRIVATILKFHKLKLWLLFIFLLWVTAWNCWLIKYCVMRGAFVRKL